MIKLKTSKRERLARQNANCDTRMNQYHLAARDSELFNSEWFEFERPIKFSELESVDYLGLQSVLSIDCALLCDSSKCRKLLGRKFLTLISSKVWSALSCCVESRFDDEDSFSADAMTFVIDMGFASSNADLFSSKDILSHIHLVFSCSSAF